MDVSGASQSCCDEEVKNIGENPEQKSFSNNSDKTDSKSIIDAKSTLTSHRQHNDEFEKETESCKIVAGVWDSFNAFQRTITNVKENDILPSSPSCDHTSAIVGSPNSFTVSTNTSPKQIYPISETTTSCSSLVVPKTACLQTENLGNLSVQTKLNSCISSSKISTSSSLPELSSSKQDVSEFKTDCRSLLESPTTNSSNCIPTCTRGTVPLVTTVVDDNMSPGAPDTTNRDFIELQYKNVKEGDIISTQYLPTTDSSNCKTTCLESSSTTPTEEPNFLEQFLNENDVPIELELAGDTCTRYLRERKINKQLREEFQNKIDKFLSKNKADSTSNVTPEDNLVASTSTDDTN